MTLTLICVESQQVLVLTSGSILSTFEIEKNRTPTFDVEDQIQQHHAKFVTVKKLNDSSHSAAARTEAKSAFCRAVERKTLPAIHPCQEVPSSWRLKIGTDLRKWNRRSHRILEKLPGLLAQTLYSHCKPDKYTRAHSDVTKSCERTVRQTLAVETNANSHSGHSRS